MVVFNKIPDYSILPAIIPLLIIQQVIAFGIGILLGTINVFFRDVGHIVNITLQYWFWFTPIVYPIATLPPQVKKILLVINPMAPVVAGYQNIFLYGNMPVWSDYYVAILFAAFVFFAGFLIFKKLSAELVDEL